MDERKINIQPWKLIAYTAIVLIIAILSFFLYRAQARWAEAEVARKDACYNLAKMLKEKGDGYSDRGEKKLARLFWVKSLLYQAKAGKHIPIDVEFEISNSSWKQKLKLIHGDDFQGNIHSARFSQDGKMAASYSADGKHILEDIKNREIIKTQEGEENSIGFTNFSPDGKFLASCSDDGDKITIWDAGNGRILRRLTGHGDSVKFACFDPTGSMLASCGSTGNIVLWNVETGEKIKTLRRNKHLANFADFSPDGKVLASCSFNNDIILWDVETGQKIKKLEKHGDKINVVDFSPDGRTLASGSDDKRIILWNVETGKADNILPGHKSGVNSVGFSPDGTALASMDEGGTINVWDLLNIGSDPISSATIMTEDSIGVSVAFIDNGNVLAGVYNNEIILWERENEKENLVLKGHSKEIIVIAFSPVDDTLVSGSSDGTVILWDTRTGEKQAELKNNSPVYSASFSPNGAFLATNSNREIIIWDVLKAEKFITLSGHNNNVNSVAFSPNGKMLASGSSDKTIKLWEIPTGIRLKTLKVRGEKFTDFDDSLPVSFSPDGKILASGSFNRTVRLWSMPEGKEKSVLGFPGNKVLTVGFSPDGKYLAATGLPAGWELALSLKLWKIPALEEVRFPEERMNLSSHAPAFSPYNNAMIYKYGEDRSYHIVKIPGGEKMGGIVQGTRTVSFVIGKYLACFDRDGRNLAVVSGIAHKDVFIYRMNYWPGFYPPYNERDVSELLRQVEKKRYSRGN